MEPLQTSDPESIDDYRLVGRLGTGGFGVVYAALGPDGQDVAIKALRRELSDDLELRQRLAREGLALRLVSGDRTVRVHDVVTTGEHAYLVMERLEGQSLDRHINTNGPLIGPELWFAAEALAEALTDIHAAGIVHRDLKPSNIIYGPQGLKVLDFGVSTVADHTALTHTGAFIGTAAWICPEQISGQPATASSDMFTLGLVLAFAATGRHPYGDGRSDAVMYRINHAQPDLDGIPEPLREAVGRCLQRNPAERPTTVQFADFLRANGRWTTDASPAGAPTSKGHNPDATRVVQSLQPRLTQTPLPATPQIGLAPMAGPALQNEASTSRRRRKRSLVLIGVIAALALATGALALTQNGATRKVSGAAAASTVLESSQITAELPGPTETQPSAPTSAATSIPTTAPVGQTRSTTVAASTLGAPSIPSSKVSIPETAPPVAISVSPPATIAATTTTAKCGAQGGLTQSVTSFRFWDSVVDPNVPMTSSLIDYEGVVTLVNTTNATLNVSWSLRVFTPLFTYGISEGVDTVIIPPFSTVDSRFSSRAMLSDTPPKPKMAEPSGLVARINSRSC